MIGRLSLRYGRRGMWLIVMGFAWMLFSIAPLASSSPSRPWVLFEQIPGWLQGLGWCTTGAVAIWQGLRGPGRDDKVGHVALYLMPAVRLFSFALAWLVYLASSGIAILADTPTIGYAQGWYATALWAVISLALALTASWPNPAQPIPRPPASAIGTD